MFVSAFVFSYLNTPLGVKSRLPSGLKDSLLKKDGNDSFWYNAEFLTLGDSAGLTAGRGMNEEGRGLSLLLEPLKEDFRECV